VNDNAPADFRTEQFEQREAQIGRPGQGILEEAAREHPKRFLPPRRAAINSESFRESKSELL
jgi:hypothetical protein